MDKEFATVLAALIGAVLGSLGAAYLQHWFAKREADIRRRDRVLQSYLLQLQDALESLWLRFHNLSHREGRSVMPAEYYTETTVYGWARVIAYSRILLLDGIYAQLSDKFKTVLKTGFDHIDRTLKNDKFQHYDRIALADALIVREGNHLRPSTYLEFRSHKDVLLRWPFNVAAATVESFDGPILDTVCADLAAMLNHISKETNMPVSDRLKELGYSALDNTRVMRRSEI